MKSGKYYNYNCEEIFNFRKIKDCLLKIAIIKYNYQHMFTPSRNKSLGSKRLFN